MLVARSLVVLAQLFLVACFAAGMVAACIVFIAYGPVPVRRKVTIVARLTPRDVFVDQPAARMISLPPNAQVRFSAPLLVAMPVEPAKPPKAPEPLVTPLVLRRPRGTTPPPLSRSRSARGTERRPRPSELELTQERTLETLAYAPEELSPDEIFLEDGR